MGTTTSSALGLHPDDAGYAAAAQTGGVPAGTGGTSVNGPGYGNCAQTALMHVDAGDLVAMKLTNNTPGRYVLGVCAGHEPVAGLQTWQWSRLH